MSHQSIRPRRALIAARCVLAAGLLGMVTSFGSPASAWADGSEQAPRLSVIAGPEQLVLGGERSGSFAVMNTGDGPETITVTPGTDAASWLSLDASTLTLASGETKRVGVTVAVPDGVAAGDHALQVEVAATPASATAGAIGGRVLSPVTVVVRVAGALVQSVDGSLQLPGLLTTTTGEITVTPRLRNTGNVLADFRPAGAAVSATHVPALELDAPDWLPAWAGGGDRLLGSGFADDKGGFTPASVSVLPGQSVDQLITLRDAPLFGWYDYRYTVPSSDGSAPTVAATGRVAVLNLLTLARVLVGLVAVALVALFGRLRWRGSQPTPSRALPARRRPFASTVGGGIPARVLVTLAAWFAPVASRLRPSGRPVVTWMTDEAEASHARGAASGPVAARLFALVSSRFGRRPAHATPLGVGRRSADARTGLRLATARRRVLPARPRHAQWQLPFPLHDGLVGVMILAVLVSSLGVTSVLARAETPSPTAAASSTPPASPATDSAPATDPAATTVEQPAPAPSQPAADAAPTPEPVATASPSVTPSVAASPAATPAPTASVTPAPVATERIIVRFKPSTSASERDAAMAKHGGTLDSEVAPLNLRVVAVPVDGVTAALAAYKADPSVAGAERDTVRATSAVVNDPDYGQQWNLPQIGWETARTVSASSTTRIAILDTGVAAGHPDLAGRLVDGWSATGGDPYTDPNGHGTAMAGIAAARTDNGIGIAGVTSDASLLSVQVLGADGTGSDSDIIAGLLWAVDHGADVVLMAFANPGASSALQAAIDYAWARGIVLVAATGNGGTSAATYPAGSAHVVGVTATDASDHLAGFAGYGADAFLAAPGVDIPALSASGGTTSVTGTSAAAAQVAGAAAQLRAIRPNDGNGTIVGRLARTAAAAGTKDQTGNGRLDLGRAVTDTSDVPVDPAGVVGSGGPLVGPYVAAATTNTSLPLRSNLKTSLAGGASTRTTLSTKFGTGVTTSPSFSTTTSFDFYSPPFTTNYQLAASDKLDGVLWAGPATTGQSITTACTLALYDFNPASGTDSAAIGTVSVNVSNKTVDTACNFTAATLTTAPLIAAGHQLHARATFTVGGNPMVFKYNAASGMTGGSTVILTQTNPVVAWPFGSYLADSVAVTSVNGGASVTSGTPFSVGLAGRDGEGNSGVFQVATGISLSATGSGTLGGTTTGQFTAGTSSLTISGVTYTNSLGESAITLTAARTSGDTPIASGTSGAFAVLGTMGLVFTGQPSAVKPNTSISPAVTVAIRDAAGNTSKGSSAAVTVALNNNPGQSTLSGTLTVNAVSGVATFSNLSLNNLGTGYTLVASSPSFTSTTSSSFDVIAGTCAVKSTLTSGLWSAPSTWACNHVPYATDDVTIDTVNDSTVTIGSGTAALAHSLTFGSATNITLNLSFQDSTSSLTVGTDVEVAAPSGSAARTLAVNAGTMTIGGHLWLGVRTSGTRGNRVSKLAITTGTVTVTGEVGMNPGGYALVERAQNQIDIGSGTLSIGGDLTMGGVVAPLNGGTLTPGTGTVVFTGSSNQTIPMLASATTYASLSYNNLTINKSSGTATLDGDDISTTNVKGSISVSSGSLDNGGHAMAGNSGKTFTVAAGATFKLTGPSSTFPTGYGVTLDPTSTTIYAGTTQTVAAQTYGHLDITGTASGESNAFAVKGNLTRSGSGTFTGSTSTVTLSGNTNQTVSGFSGANALYNLTINNATGGVTLGSALDVAGTLTLTAGIVSTTDNYTLTVTSTNANAISTPPDPADSYVNGRLAKQFATGNGQSQLFPVGSAFGAGAAYAPVSLSSLNVTRAGVLTVSTAQVSSAAFSGSRINPRQNVQRKWTVASDGALTASSYNVALNWNGDPKKETLGPLFSSASGRLIVDSYSGSTWTALSSPTSSGETTVTATKDGGAFGDFYTGNLPASKLQITSAAPSGGGSIVTTGLFDTTVKAVDSAGYETAVDSNTEVTLAGGTAGMLRGTTTGTIPAGGSSVTIQDLEYVVAGSLNLTASASGLTTSAAFAVTVLAGAVDRVLVLASTQTVAPGTQSGRTGAAPTLVAGAATAFTVYATDLYFNPVPTSTPFTTNLSDVNRSGNTYWKTCSTSAPTCTPATSFTVASVSGTTFYGFFYTASSWRVTVAATAPLKESSGVIQVNPGSAKKLQVVLDGETSDPGSSSTGTGLMPHTGSCSTLPTPPDYCPKPYATGSRVNAVVNAVDDYWNVDTTATPTVSFSTNAPSGTYILQANDTLRNGTMPVWVTFNKAGSTQTLTATDVSGNPALAPATSSPSLITPGSAAKLQVLLPGETAAPGTEFGKAGDPSAQFAGTAVSSITVNATDAYWNVVSSAAQVIHLASTDGYTTFAKNDDPTHTALTGGTLTLNATNSNAVTFLTGNKLRTLTASVFSGSTLTAGTSSQVFINPGTASKFQVLLPGESADPGSSTGKTGSASTSVYVGQRITAHVNLVDANWNVATNVSSATATIGCHDSAANATCIPETATFSVTSLTLTNGAGVVDVTYNTPTSTGYQVEASGAYTTGLSVAVNVTAVSGAGTMSVTPTSITASDSPTAFTFTFTVPTGGMASGSYVTLQVPGSANWTTPSTLNTSVTAVGGTCAAAPLTPGDFTGTGPWTIKATITADCAVNNTITISYTGSSTKVQVAAFAAASRSGTTGDPVALSVSPSVDVNPGPAHHMAFTLPATTPATTDAFTVTVTVQDAFDNTVTSDVRTISLSKKSGTAPLLGPSSVAAIGGVATFPGLALHVKGDYVLTASTTGLDTNSTKDSSSFAITAGAATKLLVIAPGQTAAPDTDLGRTGSTDDLTAGASFTLTVQAVDDYWNKNDSVTSTASVTLKSYRNTPGGDILIETMSAAKALVAGENTFCISDAADCGTIPRDMDTLKVAGTYYFDALAGGLAFNRSSTIDITAGTATKLQLGSLPSSVTAGDAIVTSVSAVDAYGNLVTTATPTVTFTSTDPKGRFNNAVPTPEVPVTLTLVAGTVDVTVRFYTVGEAGHQSFTATDTAQTPLTSVTSPDVAVSASTAAQLAWTKSPDSTTHGTTLVSGAGSPTVEVQDTYGNRVTDSSSTTVVALQGGSGVSRVLGGTLQKAAVSGVATFTDLYVKGVGSGYELHAAADGLTSGDSTAFDITQRPIKLAAVPATKPFDGDTSCAYSGTNPACSATGTPGLQIGSGFFDLAPGDAATYSQTFATALPAAGITLTPAMTFTSGTVDNYAVTPVTATGAITGTKVTAPATIADFGSVFRGQLSYTEDQTVTWVSNTATAQSIKATPTDLTGTGYSIDTSALSMWKRSPGYEGVTLTSGSWALAQTAVGENAVDGQQVFRLGITVPSDTPIGSYSGTLTFSATP